MPAKRNSLFCGLMLWLLAGVAHASLMIPIQWTEGPNAGRNAGFVRADDSLYGLILTPSLRGFPQGAHGLHIHAIPLCDGGGMMAGGHFDPLRTNVHRGPYRGSGHLGDLPVLIVNSDGKATLPLLAPRLKLADISGHALIVDAGSDDYSENAMKRPGADVRIACGVVPWY